MRYTIPSDWNELWNVSNSICYYAVWESVAMVESLTGHIKTKDNFTDLFTSAKRCRLLSGTILQLRGLRKYYGQMEGVSCQVGCITRKVRAGMSS